MCERLRRGVMPSSTSTLARKGRRPEAGRASSSSPWPAPSCERRWICPRRPCRPKRRSPVYGPAPSIRRLIRFGCGDAPAVGSSVAASAGISLPGTIPVSRSTGTAAAMGVRRRGFDAGEAMSKGGGGGVSIAPAGRSGSSPGDSAAAAGISSRTEGGETAGGRVSAPGAEGAGRGSEAAGDCDGTIGPASGSVGNSGNPGAGGITSFPAAGRESTG